MIGSLRVLTAVWALVVTATLIITAGAGAADAAARSAQAARTPPPGSSVVIFEVVPATPTPTPTSAPTASPTFSPRPSASPSGGGLPVTGGPGPVFFLALSAFLLLGGAVIAVAGWRTRRRV